MLLGLVAVGAILVAVIDPPAPYTGRDAVRGRRVFSGEPADAVEVRWDERAFSARRGAEGWEVGGRAVSAPAAEALDDLVDGLVRLRALDVFRPRDATGYGLDAPRGTITLRRGERVRRLAVGGMNAAGSAFYARREGDARVLQIGSGVASTIERVLYALDGQRPEMG